MQNTAGVMISVSPPLSSIGRHYSGVLIAAPASHFLGLIPELETIPGVEIHHRHEETGRIIAVIESENASGQEATLVRIRSLPGVLFAALVYHLVDPEGEGP
jgi:nitrate reductase NapAB chaperone NapD